MAKIGEKGFFADYSQFLNARSNWIEDLRNNPDRFVSIAERSDVSLPKDVFKNMERAKYTTDWKGIEISKDPIDLAIFQAMLQDIKPRTIIELGVLRGGSVVWFADHVKMFELECQVIGFDIDYSFLHDNAKGRDDITFLEGDCHEMENTFTEEMMQKLKHPWIIIEDAYVSIEHVLSRFNKLMKPGDYFVVEDGHPATCIDVHDVFSLDLDETNVLGDCKLQLVRRFLKKHPTDLKVDSLYADKFGYNATFNVDGFLRKM